jgi:hypothetical protein
MPSPAFRPRRSRVRRRAPLHPSCAIPVLVVALLLAPFAARQNAWREWGNSLWLIEQQRASIEALGHPSLFLHADFAVFYPQHVFYGGSLFAVGGLLATALNSAWAAYLVLLAGAFALAYGGAWWGSRLIGLDRWMAHLPPVAIVASPYWLSLVYGKGAFAELVAVSAIPLLISGAGAVLFLPRSRERGLAAVAGAAFVVSASHNITLLYLALFLVGMLAVSAWAARGIDLRAVAMVAAAAVVGGSLNAWYLLPDLAYSHGTLIVNDSREVVLRFFDSVPEIVDPLPRRPLTNQLASFVFAWVLAAGAATRLGAGWPRLQRGAWRAGWVLLAAVIVLIVWPEPWRHLPGTLTAIQFTFRLHSYAAILLALLAALALHRLDGVWWRRTAAAAVAGQAAIGIWIAFGAEHQVRVPRTDISLRSIPGSFELGQQEQFRRRGGDRLAPPAVVVPTAAPAARSEHVVLAGPPAETGALVRLEAIASPLVGVTGDARQVGTTEDGFVVAQVLPPRPGRQWSAVIEPRRPWPVRVGWLVTFAALAAFAGAGAWRLSAGRPPARAGGLRAP